MDRIKPRTIDNNWYVFDDAILSDLEISDCNDTIGGVCEYTKTLEDCIKKCRDNNDNCKVGYFIQTPETNFCVPIQHHDATVTSPYYRLRNRSYYPSLRNDKTFVFADKRFYPFPPSHTEMVFFTDQFLLQNVEEGTYLDISDSLNAIFNKEGRHIQFLPNRIKRNNIEQIQLIVNGDELVINIPQTALTLNKTEVGNNQEFDWKMRLYYLGTADNTFRIHSTDKNKKQGDLISYGETFYFTFGDGRGDRVESDYPVMSEAGRLSLENGKLVITTGTGNSIFRLIPKISVYYEENGICKSIPLEETDNYTSYRGFPVYRNSDCWIIKKKKINSFVMILIILGIVILICVPAVLILKKYVN